MGGAGRAARRYMPSEICVVLLWELPEVVYLGVYGEILEGIILLTTESCTK